MSPYFDSELGQTKTYEISEHLQQCEKCARRFEAEGRVDEMIRDRIGQERMPEALWDSLSQVVQTPRSNVMRFRGSRLAMAAVLVFAFVGVMVLWPQRGTPTMPRIVQAFLSTTPDNAPFGATGDRTVLAQQVNATLRRDFGIEIPVPTPEQLAPHTGFELVSATTRTDEAGHRWVEVRLNCCGQPLLVAYSKGGDGTLPRLFDGIDGAGGRESTYEGVRVASRRVGGGTAVAVSRHPIAGVLGGLRVLGT